MALRALACILQRILYNNQCSLIPRLFLGGSLSTRLQYTLINLSYTWSSPVIGCIKNPFYFTGSHLAFVHCHAQQIMCQAHLSKMGWDSHMNNICTMKKPVKM